MSGSIRSTTIEGVLRPCPFCGGQAVVPQPGDPYVRCSTCRACGPYVSFQTTGFKRTEDAKIAWNTRRRVKGLP